MLFADDVEGHLSRLIVAFGEAHDHRDVAQEALQRHSAKVDSLGDTSFLSLSFTHVVEIAVNLFLIFGHGSDLLNLLRLVLIDWLLLRLFYDFGFPCQRLVEDPDVYVFVD